MSTVIVRMRVKPEKEARFLEIFREVCAKMETGEPDARAYMVWRAEAAHEYVLVESYRTEAGREFHNQAHTGVFQEFMDCLAETPETEALGEFVVGVAN